MYPVETIIAKTRSNDFRFFLEQPNFLKVVDTLEKFEKNCIDQTSIESKDFRHFKKQLYKMYEVQNRSVYEHEQYSFEVSRRNLGHLYKANMSFLNEVAKVNELETRADYGMLKDKVFVQKPLS